FERSVFPCACLNLGCTVCSFHRDPRNLPYGWNPVTVFGPFDHTKGGHIVLEDFNIMIQAPHGTSYAIMGACVSHGNAPLADPTTEHRSSFTQYMPGGLRRWVDNGGKTDKQLKETDPIRYKEVQGWKQGNWDRGIGMLSTLDEV
ncbi:hypothetical protein CYLTODRAFT_314150, partial [Cylindrobasidium torrendii FP15055 ss-10]